ncbi:Chaperone protein [Nymphaea thermarum]|nr:Chaperone protein [Nymphaea thermarum]
MHINIDFYCFLQISVCPTCGGDGQTVSEYCRKCAGEGRVRTKKDIRVKVPPGVSQGSTLRVRGEGDAGPRGGPPGDLYVYLNVEEIEGIQRDGINLCSTVSISYLDAILGAVVKVKTVDGVNELQIPPGTQPGDVIVLSKRGVPKLNKPSVRGDHLFTVKVTLPNRIRSCVSGPDPYPTRLVARVGHYLSHSQVLRSIGVFRRDLAVRVFPCCLGIRTTSGSVPLPRVPHLHLGIRAHCRLEFRVVASESVWDPRHLGVRAAA